MSDNAIMLSGLGESIFIAFIIGIILGGVVVGLVFGRKG